MDLLDKIKDDYAKENGYVSWVHLQVKTFSYTLMDHENKVMQLCAEAYFEEKKKAYAMECLKRAYIESELEEKKGNSGTWYWGVKKSSIVNENNLI